MKTLCVPLLLCSLAACNNLKDDSDRTRTEGALAGAGLGAAAGAGVGALVKKTPGGAAAGAAAGALIGGAAGAAYGDSVAKKKEGYAKKESALDAQLSGLHQQIATRREYNEKLRTLVTGKEEQLKTILASDRSAGPTVQEFDLRTSINTKLQEIDQASSSWQETIDAHKSVLKKATDDPHSSELQTAIDQLTEQRAELLRQRAKLAALPDKLKQ
jgi:hypothetical protein